MKEIDKKVAKLRFKWMPGGQSNVPKMNHVLAVISGIDDNDTEDCILHFMARVRFGLPTNDRNC